MELSLQKIISHGAFHIAVASDETQLAISSERQITILSLPELLVITTVRIAHASSMIYLADNCSILILNTTGKLFLWNGKTVSNLGRWPVPRWAEVPLFSGGKYAFWSLDGVVWRYDIANKEMKMIYSSDNDLSICRCDDGLVKMVGFCYQSSRQFLKIITIDYDGNIVNLESTKQSIPTFNSGIPCWTQDNVIAISTISNPDDCEFPRQTSLLYLFDGLTGETLFQKGDCNRIECGDCYCGENVIAAIFPVFSQDMEFYYSKPSKLLEVQDQSFLNPLSRANPPTQIHFLSKSRILVGSWKQLCMFSCTDSIHSPSTAHK